MTPIEVAVRASGQEFTLVAHTRLAAALLPFSVGIWLVGVWITTRT